MAEARDIHLHEPQTLYRHWEEEQWSPWDVDLSADLGQWPRLSGEDRGLILWALSSLMVAEERITTKFSGLVGAHGTEEEATFLATQQVDEARAHAVLRPLPGRGDRRPGDDRRTRGGGTRAALAGVLSRLR